jgi:hypothetical protein
MVTVPLALSNVPVPPTMAKVTGLLNWLNRTTPWVSITPLPVSVLLAVKRDHGIVVRKYFDDRASKYERALLIPILVFQHPLYDEKLVAR